MNSVKFSVILPVVYFWCHCEWVSAFINIDNTDRTLFKICVNDKESAFFKWFYQLMWFHHCSLSTDFCGFYSWCIHEIDSSLKYGTYDNDLCWLRAIMSKHLHVLKALIPMNIYETTVSYALTQTKLVWTFIDTTLKSIQLKWFW